jgi:hypothetical protein
MKFKELKKATGYLLLEQLITSCVRLTRWGESIYRELV